MSADFWAGYISGAAGIILGNPLDVLKVRLQAGTASSPPQPPLPAPTPTTTTRTATSSPSSYLRPFLLGTAAPVLGYGALNALLFVSYNRTEAFLNSLSSSSGPGSATGDLTAAQGRGTNLLTTWLAGAVGGLATWAVSTPTELVKCRAQLQVPSPLQPHTRTAAQVEASSSSWQITKQILRTSGVRGLYVGGTVTALRDSIGYGFYFWGYELCSRWMEQLVPSSTTLGGETGGGSNEAAKVLLCGGLAGIITWASIFPLDVIKTRVQTQEFPAASLGDVARAGESTPLLSSDGQRGKRLGAWEVAKETYRTGGVRPFFRGLGVCSVRAFFVNAVQWAVYEWIMMELGQGRTRRPESEGVGIEVA